MGQETRPRKSVDPAGVAIRRIAHRYVQREREGQTLQTTALVNEAYLRLAGSAITWQNRAHYAVSPGDAPDPD